MGFILGSLLVALGSERLGPARWWPLTLAVSLLAVPLALCSRCLPESPRWLLQAARGESARGPAQNFSSRV